MKPNKYNNKRFNDSTGGFWLITQHRFTTDKHPVVLSKEKCSAKVTTLVSEQELQMIEGLGNMVQGS